MDVHVAFDRRRDGAQLDVAVLGDRGDAGGEAARQPDKHVLDGRRAVIFGGENFRMIGVEGEGALVVLFLAEAVIAFDRGVAVRAVLPLASGAPFELRRLWSIGERFASRDQRRDVHAIIDGGGSAIGLGHATLPYA